MTTFTEKLSIFLDVMGASSAVGDFNKVAGASRSMGSSTTLAGGKLDQLAGKLGVTGSAMSTGLVAAATAGATAIATFAIGSVAKYQALTQEVLNFQRASGASAEQSSQLVAAFDDMGISAESGSKGIFNLGKKLETSAASLAAYGIVAVKNKAGNTDLAATLLSVADAYQRTTDPAKQAGLLTAAFGKSGRELIPILAKGRAGIEAMFADAAGTGQIFDQGDLQRSEKFRLSIDDMQDTIGELSLVIGEGLVPVLTKLLGGVTDGAEKAGGAIGWLRHQMDNVLPDFVPTDWSAMFGTEEMGDAAEAADALGTVFSRVVGTGREWATTVDTNREALDGLLSATLASTAAGRAVEAATRAQTDAQADLNKLLADGAVDEEKVADARRSLADATRSAAGAQRDLAKAQGAYDDAAAAAAILGTDTAMDAKAAAADNLADATDSKASADERAATAAADLKKAEAGDPEYQQKVADAKQRVADAQYNLGTQTYAAVKAEEAQKLALAGSADEAFRLRGEIEKLIALYPALAPLLAGTLAALPAGSGSTGLGNLTTSGPLSALSGVGGFPKSTTTGAGGTTTINNTFHNQTDPVLVAHQIMWGMN